MIKRCFLFAFYLSVLLIYRPLDSAAEVYVTFNPEECSVCIKSMEYLKALKENVSVLFVIEEKYKADSVILIDDFFLKDFHAAFIWSDSLFQKFAVNGTISSVNFIMDDKAHRMSIPLRDLTSGVVNWFNKYAQKSDTISVAIPNINAAKLYSSGLEAFFTNNIRNEIYSFSLSNKQLNYSIFIPDSLVRSSYKLALGDSSYEKNMQQLNEWKVPKIINIDNVWADEDSLYTVMSYKCLLTYHDQLGVGKFYTLNTYYNGKLSRIASLPMIIPNKVDTFFFLPFLHFWKGTLYGSLLGSSHMQKRSFLLKYKNEKGRYMKDSIWPDELPKVYKNYNFGNTVFFKQYYALPLEDKIYSLADTNTIISLNIFPKNNDADLYKLPKCYISQFKMNESYLWLLYRNNEQKTFYFLKYDRKAHEILFNEDINISFGDGDPVIDDFNYNCILYQTKKNDLVRVNYTL